MSRYSFLFLWIIYVNSLFAAEEVEKYTFQSKMGFKQNLGQIKYPDDKPAPEVKYIYKQGNLKIFLLNNGLAYQLEKYEKDTTTQPSESLRLSEGFYNLSTYRMDMELLGANPNPEIIAEGKSSDYTNYYQPELIQTHSYQKVTYKNIYPGIDWVIYTLTDSENKNDSEFKIKNSKLFKYDFIVHPGADPSQIKLKYKNAEQLFLDQYGNLILRNRLGDIREDAPLAIQNQEKIIANYLLKDSIVSFYIKNYNPTNTLIIDPKLEWSTYYGGSGNEDIYDCNVDGHNNVYITGRTTSTTNIGYNGFQTTYQTGAGAINNGFIVKFNPRGQRLWASYYGVNYRITNIVTDKNNCTIVVGFTSDMTTNSANNGHQNNHGGGSDGLIVKFDSAGTRLWASYYGGNGNDNILSCDIDDSCSIYFTGTTTSSTGIAQNGYQDTFYTTSLITGPPSPNSFIVKLNEQGVRQWASYYGLGQGSQIVIFKNSLYLFFTNSKVDTHLLYSDSYFISPFTGNLYGLSKFTLTGQRIFGKPILLDSRGIGTLSIKLIKSNQDFLYTAINITNVTYNGKVASGFQPNFGGGVYDIYIAKLDTIGNIVWDSYSGSNGDDLLPDITFDKYENLYLAGRTNSNTGIAYRGLDSTLTGSSDIFITKISKSGNRIWSSYIGGNGFENLPEISCDKENNLYLAGYTTSTSSMSFNGHQNTLSGFSDAFLMKISCNIYDTIRDTICRGDTLLYRSKKYTQAGFYTDSFLTWDICDSFITLHLTVLRKDTTYLYDTICSGTSYIWNGQNRTISGVYRDTLINNVGCDSFLILNLHIKRTDTVQVYDTSCNNLPKIFNGASLTISGIYRDTLKNSLGCDSHIFYHFIPKPIYETPITRAICASDSSLFGGRYLKLAGVYYDTLKTKQGCDSVIKLTLTINPLDTNRQTQAICRGKSYNFYSQVLTNAGTYSHKLTNRNGCDSTILMAISVIDSSTYTFSRMLCSGQSFPFNNQILTQAGAYRDTFMNSLGCDSFVTLNLSFSLVLYDTLRQTVCAGQAFRGYSSPGTYYETYISSQGCDSILTIYLKHLSATEYKTITHSKCGAFRYGSRTYYQNDSFTETIKNYLNCDSIVTKHFVYITEPKPKFLADKTIDFCEEILHRGQLKTKSFFTQDTIKSLEFPYCDSLYQPYYYRRESRPVLTARSKQVDTVIKGETTIIQVSGAQYYRWTTGEQIPAIRPQITEDKTFEVTAWNLTDCEEKMQFRIIAIDQPLIDFPTAFSPNGDGLNDYFTPNTNGNITIDYFQIFNRWGEKVYEHRANSKGWDGTFLGKPAPTGLYGYTLRYSYLGRYYTKSGEVMVVR